MYISITGTVKSKRRVLGTISIIYKRNSHAMLIYEVVNYLAHHYLKCSKLTSQRVYF